MNNASSGLTYLLKDLFMRQLWISKFVVDNSVTLCWASWYDEKIRVKMTDY